MSLVRFYDAAYPPGRPYPGCAAVAGYIGGNTPHVWTVGEWNRANGGGQLAQLPIWVGYLEADPAGHARDAAAAAKSLGWIAHHPLTWRAIALDMEAEQDEAWILAFGRQLQAEGFLCWPYMSASALPSDPPGYTVWLATWNGTAAVPPVHDVIAAQFAHDLGWDGTAVDLSVIGAGELASFGHGPRR